MPSAHDRAVEAWEFSTTSCSDSARLGYPDRPPCFLQLAEVVPAGQQLVHVGLVAGVEDDRVPRRVEDAVQRDGELDDAEVGAEVAAGLATPR